MMRIQEKEAGGKLTAWDGKLDIEKPDVLASNGILHQQALDIICGPLSLKGRAGEK